MRSRWPRERDRWEPGLLTMPGQPTSGEKQDEDETASITGNDGYAAGCAPASRGLSVA